MLSTSAGGLAKSDGACDRADSFMFLWLLGHTEKSYINHVVIVCFRRYCCDLLNNRQEISPFRVDAWASPMPPGTQQEFPHGMASIKQIDKYNADP